MNKKVARLFKEAARVMHEGSSDSMCELVDAMATDYDYDFDLTYDEADAAVEMVDLFRPPRAPINSYWGKRWRDREKGNDAVRECRVLALLFLSAMVNQPKGKSND